MFQSLKKIFESPAKADSEESFDNLNLLCGLMIEAANTDGIISQEEVDQISNSLIHTFKEDPLNVENALIKALDNKNNTHSLHYYTSKINKKYSDSNKLLLIETLWEIILSDNEIHDFESNLIRRLAGLLYISDVNCGKAKNKAQFKFTNRE